MIKKDIKFIAACVIGVIVTVTLAHFAIPYFHDDGTKVNITQAKDYAYIASINSEVYHRNRCRYIRKISPANLRGFESVEKVQKSGRRPCKVCRP